MKLVGRDRLEAFTRKHAQARGPIRAWVAEVKQATWVTMAELKDRYPAASVLSDNTVIFNLGGNKYRLETRVLLGSEIVIVLRIGTHSEYDKWK